MKIKLSMEEKKVAEHVGSACWWLSKSRGDAGGLRSGTERHNQIGSAAEIAMARWAKSCCPLVLLRTQKTVPGDIGFEAGCSGCFACKSLIKIQVKATEHVNGHLCVKSFNPREDNRYWLSIVENWETREPTINFVGYVDLSSASIDDLQRWCELAQKNIGYEEGEDTNRWLHIPQNELKYKDILYILDPKEYIFSLHLKTLL